MNREADFNGSVDVVQPIEFGLIDKLNEQDGLYTLYLQEIKDGKAVKEHKIINIKEVTEELGYEDSLVDVGEQFHLWVIEGPQWIKAEFPVEKAELNVKFVEDMTPYRTRKVRILNGAHTSLVPVAYLYGLNTVGEAVEDQVVGKFVKSVIYDEIIPTLDLSEEELKYFVETVLERFMNPFVKHYLMSIALNSMSKFETRDLPSLLEYINRKGKLPEKLVFSLASLIEFYKGRRGEEYIKLIKGSLITCFSIKKEVLKVIEERTTK